MRWLEREGSRTTLVVALLVVSFLVTAAMALRATMTATYYRTAAQRVVRDWTQFALNELVRRAEAQISFYGTYPVLQMMVARSDLSTPEGLAAVATPDQKRSIALVRRVFRYAADSKALKISEPLPADANAALLTALAELTASPPARSDQEPIRIGPRFFAYTIPPGGKEIAGIEVDQDEAVRFSVPSVLRVRPLLPPSLGGGSLTNDFIVARVADATGRTVFATRGSVDPQLSAHKTIEDGVLRGMTADLSIAPEASRLLVFGGVPPRTLPVYISFLVVTAILLTTAVLQLRKERALAGLRSEFVASVSHELRTPLTQVRMFTETLLLDRVRSDDERTRALSIIDRESRRLAQLVENILQFSRGERGTLRLVRTNRNVADVVRETVDAFLPIAAARSMTIRTDLAPDVAAAIDSDAMRQVLLNLLDNAAKYGPTGQTIAVALTAGGPLIRLTVEDEGPGVPPRDRKRVWRRYERLEREQKRAVAGAGIGLSVVRDLVGLHGGSVTIEDGAVGARFVITLPREERA